MVKKYLWHVKRQSFKRIFYLTGFAMLVLVAAQVYRTVKNYELNKQRFITDVQHALDLSVESYYAGKAKEEVFLFSSKSEADSTATENIKRVFEDIAMVLDSSKDMPNEIRINATASSNSIEYNYSSESDGKGLKEPLQVDSAMSHKKRFRIKKNSIQSDSAFVFISDLDGDSISDFLNSEKIRQQFAEQILISISEGKMDLRKLSNWIEQELARKKLTIGFQLVYETDGNKALPAALRTKDKLKVKRKLFPDSINVNYPLSTYSKSTYLPEGESLKLSFENASLVILKRGLGDLLISLAVILAVLSAFLYLFRVINAQKQLALIKDDLISNITHEFKTPIATIHSAIEGIDAFNDSNDKEKTKRYLSISSGQLKKLNLMVEKLLETASIDSGELEIAKEETDLNALTERVVRNYKLLALEKTIDMEIPEQQVWYNIDPFHMENALSNLIDNAIKYGGNKIWVRLSRESGKPIWEVRDNGGNIEKPEQQRIFEKLYRIPKGNQHDVKGFGIGLYYARAIVEKHGGEISLEVEPNITCFKIYL